MKKIENVKIFDLANPNTSIRIDPNDLLSMLKNVPILENDDEYENFNSDRNIFGYVDSVTEINGHEVFGDVYVLNDEIENIVFKNYSIQVEPVVRSKKNNDYVCEIRQIYDIAYEIK